MSILQSVTEIIKSVYDKKLPSRNSLPVNQGARTLIEYYAEYKYIVSWGNKFTSYRQFRESIAEAAAWCDRSCVGEWDSGIHRVIREHNEWVFNGIAGDDIIFWVFTNEQDAMMFKLTCG